MVDPITAGVLAATVVPLASGVAGEAGRQVWGSLAAFVRQRFARGSEADTAVEAVTGEPGEALHGEVLGRILERAAQGDQEVALWLGEWLRQAAPLADQPDQSAVTNAIGGQARVDGPVIQAHTINGPITFGSPGPSAGQ